MTRHELASDGAQHGVDGTTARTLHPAATEPLAPAGTVEDVSIGHSGHSQARFEQVSISKGSGTVPQHWPVEHFLTLVYQFCFAGFSVALACSWGHHILCVAIGLLASREDAVLLC